MPKLKVSKTKKNQAIVKYLKKFTTIFPELYAKLVTCPPTSASVDRSFSLLKSMICENRNIADANLSFYNKLYFNS